jgi:hypothetical protein
VLSVRLALSFPNKLRKILGQKIQELVLDAEVFGFKTP